MTTNQHTVTVYFDFLCPFAYRANVWLEDVAQQIDLSIDWKYFALEQVNAPLESGWKLWEQPEDYMPRSGHTDRRSLLAFWAAEAARQQGAAAFDRFRMALYHARHRDGGFDFGQRDNFTPIAERAELEVAQFQRDFADRSLLDALRRDHEEGRAKYQVFGVPTICFDDENAFYLKLAVVPPTEDSVPLFEELRHSITSRRWLSEIKRPNP